MAPTVTRRHPRSRCILQKAILVFAFAVCWFRPVRTSFMRFKPDTEYIYTFHSSADLKKVRTLEVDSKIGFQLVKSSDNSSGYQQIYLRVHSVVVTSDKEQVHLSEERDFNEWFSFDFNENGVIGQVYYPRDDDDHVIETKKGMASLLAGNLQHPKEGQLKQGTWSYDCNETSHEGQHEASYTAKMAPGYEGIIVFTKTRRTHPIPYGKSEHQKVIHYHPGMQLPSMVKIIDSFDAPRQSTPGFEEQLHKNSDEEEEDDDFEFPEMKSSSEAQLTFINEIYSPSPNGQPENEDIVTDSIQIKQHSDRHLNFNSTQLKEFIFGNLTCVRKAPLKGSHERSHCYQDLVDTLLTVPGGQQLAEIVSPFYKLPLSRRARDKSDRFNMLDAVAGMHTETSQSLLTDLILLSPNPNEELVERLLIASAGFIHTISQHYIETVEDIVFKPGGFPEPLRDPEIQRVAVLVLGALAGLKWKAGYKTQAEEIVVQIEDKLGVHDPWAYDRTLTSLTEDEQHAFHHDTVAWIEALGNAGLHRSFPHIQSYTNSSTVHPLLKRAGLHSMRDYHHDTAANILLQSALDKNEDKHVRYEASLFYKVHPNGGNQNLSKFINPESYPHSDPAQDSASSEVAASIPFRHRVRRGFWKGIQFNLASPSKDWKKRIGSSKTGAQFGLTIRNELDMDIAPLSGHLRVDLYDEAFATALVGLVGQKLDIARARFCFNGFIEYNLNILQEFGVERINDLAKVYDIIIGQVVGNIVRGVDIVVDLFNGEPSIGQLFDEFVQTLETIPTRISSVRSESANAVARLSQFDPDQLPPSIRGVIDVVNKAAQLFSDIKTDIMEFYQAVNEAITVTLPWASEQIWMSINSISDNIGILLKSPPKAIGDILKGIINIKIAVDAILEAKMEVEEANFFKEGQRPYWFDLPKVIGDMLRELREHLGNIRRDLAVWVDEVKSSLDPIKKLTGGAIDSYTLRRQVQEEIVSIILDLIGPIEPIQDLLAPFFELYDLVFDTINAIKEAYLTLKDGYQKSQTLINKLFGPKAHKIFPRKYREPGSGACASGGFYPTDSAGNYQDQGVDLEVSQGRKLVAPFSGILFKSVGKPYQVTLLARGGAFRNIKMFIDNITPNSSLSTTKGLTVIAGSQIGVVRRSSTCTPPNYIHFSVKNIKPNRLASILDSNLNDEPTAADDAAKEGYVDPSNYLAKRPLEIPQWIQVCDDYKLVWRGKTVKEGSLLKRENKNGQKSNTSPKRKSSPNTSSNRPNQSKRPPARRSNLNQAVSKENKQETMEALDLPETKTGSGSPFKNFTLRNLKIGSILAFARKLGLEETADDLLTVVKTIVKLVSDKPCVLPESLTSDTLRIELQQRGLSSQGDRKTLIQRYKQPEDRCPLIQVSLPKNVYCKIDESCLGVECCMNIKLFMISLAFKAFMRFDPCEFQFILGVNSWNYTIQILDAEFGKELDVPVPFEIPFVDDMEMHLRYGIEKSRTQLLVSMSVGFCPTTGDADCLPFISILKDSAIPVPICHPNGTITWPDFDLKEYFSRAALKTLIKSTGEELLRVGTEAALSYVLDELGIPKELLDGKEACPSPTSLSNSQLTATLEERQLATTGTRMDLELRLSQDDRTCQFFTLPAFSPELAKVVYCSLTDNCLRLDCCLELNIQRLKFRRSFKAYVEVDACDFTFYIAFQHLQYKKLLLSYNWGQPEEQMIGSAITLRYSINKLDAEKEFEIDFGASICSSDTDCVFDIDIIQNYRVPIPFCNSNFSFSLPGGDDLKDFVTQVGRNAGREAVNILLEYIGLRDKINDGPCGSTAVSADEEMCTSVTLPSLPRSVTCDLADRCLGIRCCVELDLKVTVLSVNMWLILDPCEFTLSIGLGTWSITFTIFDYHWGTQEQLQIGDALTLIYTIDKLTEQKVFVLDLAFSICLPESECDTPSIDLLKDTQVPIPLCNENATFALPGGTVKGFLQMVGRNAAESAVDAILEYLGLADYISQAPCERPQVTQNGWQRICPKDIKLPRLPQNLICTLPEKCLGFDCCLELPIPGITPISTTVSFIFDPCNYQLSMSLGSWSQNLQIFSYQWGQREEVSVGGPSGAEPITLSVTIDKLDAKESFQINLDISICIDSDCSTIPVLSNSLVPIPFCNLNASFELPGDGSFEGLARQLAGNVGELAIQAGLRKLGIQQYVDNQECEMGLLAPSENKCPLLRAPTPTNLLACTVDDRCLGLTCCASLDLVFTQLSTTAYALFDPCEFQLSVGLGTWSKVVTIFQFDWGVERTLDIGDAVHIVYNIDKLSESKEFLIDLSVTLCIDGTCKPIHLLQAAHIPIPICNPNATFALPGDGSISGYLTDLGGQVTDVAVDLVLDYLNLKNFLSRNPCNLPPAPPAGSPSCPVQFPDTLPQLSCRIDGLCTSLRCCLNFDLKVTHISSKAWFELDACDYKLSVGLELWYFNVSLFSYEWGTTESFMIGDALEVRFSIDKLDASKEYEVDLAFSLSIDGIATDFPVMVDKRIPIPICNANFSAALPGDGSIKGFLDELGDNVGQAAIQLVLKQLNLQDVINGRLCELPSDVATNNHCPRISLPFLEDIVQCSIDDRCLGIQCCTTLDFVITQLMLSARIRVDPCNFELYVAFENWELNVTLFSYTWGEMESVQLGNAVTLSYSIDKLTARKVFSVTLNLGLCIDDTCTTTPVLEGVWVPIPLCNTNASAFSLPGDGTVDGFIRDLGGRIGNSAIDLVLEKLGLNEYLQSAQCNRGIPGTLRSSCPAVDLSELPDFLSCTVTDTCLGIRCCLEMDLKITTRSVNAWIILDPCHFNLSIGFEKWELAVTLFHYPLGDEMEEEINSVLSVRWRVAKITQDKQFEIDLALVFCVDGSCDTLTVFEGSRLPIPLCNIEDSFTLPGDGSISGFLSYLGGNIGQFAVDAAIRHLNLGSFLTGKACSYHRQDVCASSTSILGNCSVIGATCTELRCCLELDLKIADVSATAWFKFDPCDFTFTLGLERWTFHGSIFSYQWGMEMTESITSDMTLTYSINKLDDTKEFELSMTLEYCIDGVCSDISIQHTIPIPVCNPGFSNYTLSADGFIETVAGQVIQGASVALLTRLGIDPDIFSSQPCVYPIGNQTFGNCPSMQLPSDLSTLANCGILNTCFGIQCCLDVNLGPLSYTFGASMVIDPCLGLLSLQFGNWEYSKSLSHLDFGTSQEITIGNFVTLRYMLELADGEISFSLSMDACIDGQCTGTITLLDEAESPLPTCYPNGTISWRSLPGVTSISHLGSLDVGFEAVAQVLGLPSRLVSASPCPPVLLPGQSGACPHLPRLPSLPSGGVCYYSDACLGVECCLAVDLGLISRTLRAWLIVDPCDFRLSVGFENWSYNVTLLSYKFGKVTRERLSDAISLTFTIDKSADNRNFLLSLSIQLCIAGVCAPDITLLDGFTAPIPFCNPNGNLEWAQVGSIGDYASGLVVNRLSVSADVLLPAPCSGPPEQITPATSGCGHLALPSAVAPYCSLDQSCLGIGCCLNFDLGIVQRSFSLWVKLDPCAQTFSFGFEKWSHSEALGIQLLQSHSFERNIGVVKIRYDVERPHATVYDVDLDISLCWDGVCAEPTIILRDALFSGAQCGDSGSGSARRRKRRSVDDLASESEEGMGNMEELTASSIDKARDYLKSLVAEGENATLSADANQMMKLQPDKVVEPRLAGSGTASRRSMCLLVISKQDDTPVTSRRRRDLSVSVNSGGTALFGLSLEPGADSGTWQGDLIIGGGLTQKGLDALGQRIANMTIGELEAMLDLQNLDPLTVVQLMKDLRALFRTFVEELIDVITTGSASDNFEQFDIVLSGTIPFPRRETVFFRYSYITYLGGLITLEFKIKAGGFFDMEIPVSVGIVSMTATGGVTPMVGAYVTASVSVCYGALCGVLELKADIMHTSFPTTAEIVFSKFPLDVGLKLDIEMIPLTIVLKGKVTIKIPLIGKETLYSKELWRYEASKITGNIFYIQKEDPDTSPPEISAYSTPDGVTRRSAGGNNQCGVEQVPGLDYTEPAFQLEMVAADDKSIVTFFYQVGTAPGGSDVLEKTEFGGPSAIITQTLLGGRPIHFTVYAMNNGGGKSTATCSLPTFDVTLPTGRITPDFISTSHPHVLRASAVVYDDSVILMQKEGVGFGVEIWGDQIIPWNAIDISKRQNIGTSVNDFNYFTAPTKGRLISTPTATINQPNPNQCARDCLALPETKCLSINYDYRDFTCELLEEIEGHGVEVHESGFYAHYERLGIGHAVKFSHDSVLLVHNNLYYFNIELLNYVAYENIISSVAIIADFTPPDPGLIVNQTRDDVVQEACVDFTPDEWERRCIEDTPLDNHRYIIDGLGSMTVFNGHKELVDMLYTRSNTFMAANWEGFHDNETGIHGYTWSIGYDICDDDVSMHIDPHAHLFDESEWTHQGLVVNVNLPDGLYFITVRALNKVEFGGPMALSVCHSTPLIIDNTPPIIYSIYDITYDSSIGRIGMLVNATDPESNLYEYHIAAGRTPRDVSLRDWKAHVLAEQLFTDFKIPNGIPCWVKVRAVNNVDLRAIDHADEPILVDDTPPIAGDLFDGPYAGRDLVFTKDRNEICANWYNWYDPESGIFAYQWAVGNSPGLTNVQDFIEVSRRQHTACSGYVTLQHGETYYSTLIAFHGGYDKLNVSASSNGVTVDLTPPLQGDVYDGLLEGPTDLEFSSRPATVEAQWQGFSDPDSGIEDYEVTVYRKHADSANITNDFEIIHEADSVGSETSSIEWHHFHLRHKDQVYVNLRTINQALNHIDTPTNGFLIDLTPPMLRALGDGLVVGQDADFQSHDDSLSVHWDYFDDESGIESYELAIYEMKQGNKLKIFPMDANPNSFQLITDITSKSHVQTGLALRSGSIYITRIKARNQAKLIASHETSGIRVDPSPPVMRYVRGGNLDGEIEEIINGYLYQNSHTTIQASWLAVDGQSGIKSYWVAVGTSPESEDVRPFTFLGSKGDGIISNLNLQLTDKSSCDDEAFTAACQPVYYVCVKSENGAGAFSDVICSSPIRVVEEDQTGYVTDGPSMLQDLDAQMERTTVTIWFDDFESELHGIAHYEWAVGTSPGGEDVQPLTSDGIVPGSDTGAPGLAGRGKAQSPLPLQHGVTYYSTLRAITNAENILESTSNGFQVDITPPEITMTELGLFDASKDLNLDGGIRLYQPNSDSIDATWEIEEGESEIVVSYFLMGQYPGSDDIFPLTATNKSYIPLALITPVDIGFPNFLSIGAVNSVGLKRTIYATSVTVDNTPPGVGQVHCPAFIHADSALLCRWSDFLDAESGVDHVQFLVGTGLGQRDVYQSGYLSSRLTHYSVKDLNLIHNKVYYVTVEAFNAINQSTLAFSGPIEIDDTPPSYGLVVELSGVHRLNFSDLQTPPVWDCTDAESCLLLDGECLESINQLQILWQAFSDEDTEITKYEVALGTTPGGSQIRSFYEVSRDQTSELITDIDLSQVRKVYATVRGYNQAGLTSTAVSDGIFVSRFSAGLQPLRPFEVKDGITDNDLDDSDFQTSLNVMSAAWDFTGDPCPMKKYEWSIYRIDGQEIQPLINVGERTSDSNTGIEMTDGETYYTVVRATNALGLIISVRSDGITVKRDPLIPGRVYDGLLVGFDLTYQKETDSISASWSGFGQGMPAKATVEHTGNAEVTKDDASEQSVDFYEVAVGTDRRYPKTRDNVVPFTYVGKNTTVTFSNLELAALDSTYYVTVRGHSASFATAEVTSTGINVGVDSEVVVTEVEIPEYVNSVSEVQLQWDEFESTFPILLYYVGLGKPSPSSIAPEDMDCLDMLVGTQQSQATFNERPMQFAGKDTFVKVTALNLAQEGSYYVTVVGMNEAGQCNSSTSYFSVDITPPIEGQLRAGPFYDMKVTYTDSVDAISVAWEGYKDEESDMEGFNLRLVEAASCSSSDADNLTPVTNQEWLVLGPDIRDFTFVDLSLVSNHPYFVQLLAINQAGNSIQTQVGPIFVDPSEPTAGLVVDGVDFKMDITDTGDRHQVHGTILHLPDPVGPPCPLRDIPFSDPQWSALDFKGLWNMQRADWELEYHAAQVFASEESVVLKLERDTRGPRMLSGAYITNAQIIRSSEYEFDLIAAPPDLNSVTSILFWDGPDGAIGEFDFPGRENWQGGICLCCYAVPLNQSACPLCDCRDFLGVQESADSNTTLPSTTSTSQTNQAVTTDDAQALRMTTTVSPWAIRKADADGDSISDDDSGRWITQRACGFQLYPNGNSSQAVLWCRYYEDDWPMTSEPVNLDFDPSVEERHYSIQIKVTPFDADEDEWSFDVYVDGELLASLTGIPVMSPSTKLILHVFNRDSYVAELLDPFKPPSVTATLRNLRMPPDQSVLCRYGAPFRAGTSPVSRYFAGIGSEAKQTDIVAFEEIARPCVPCINPCDHYQCDPSCSMDAAPITFTLTNFTLPRLELRNMTGANQTNSTTTRESEEGLLYPFYLTVKSYLGNGKAVVASSNGFYVDDTPAQLNLFFYTDNNLNEFEPTWFQSSESTIKVLWSFVDMESGIKGHYWAIGTSRGATDIQDFIYVGLNQTGISRDLTGLLFHNTTYYVTLKAINGAGLEAIIKCDGITVLLEDPSADDVNTTSMFSERFEEGVYPPDVEKSEDPTKTGTSWSQPKDDSITRYEYCVGSSADVLDDIVPCMAVGGNSSGSIAIEGGLIIVKAGDREETYSITDFQIPRDTSRSTGKPGNFNMEPGKSLHSWMKMCNSARLCVTVSAGTTTILGDSDLMMTSPNGTDLVLTSATTQRRRRRSIDNHFEFTVATSGGLHDGGSLVLGLLDFNRTSQEFTSDASPDYKPYVTNPVDTIQYTSRLLRNRILFVYEPTFYVTSLGQTELRGPMLINFTLTAIGSWTEARPRLIYWNNQDSEWQDAAKTCSDMDRITYLEEDNQVNVEVCATKKTLSASRSRRAVEEDPVVLETTYFSQETQFALAEIRVDIPNSPPEITNLPGNMFMNEDEGTLVFTFLAFDPEDDVLVYELGLRGMRGEANITQEGVFSFTPCPDCHGLFSMEITVREIQTLSEIEPLSTTVTVVIVVRPVNDNPVLYIGQNGLSIGNGRIALLTVEQNTGANVAYGNLIAELGAYDVDMGDTLTLINQPPIYGSLELATPSNTVPSSQDCSKPSSGDIDAPTIPCDLELPHNADAMSWTTIRFTYTPNLMYHGRDSFLVLLEDRSQAVSQLLEIQIAVLANPCINEGVCGGPEDDQDCTSPVRSSGFDSYFCVCTPGWVGDTCETDYDDCQSTPCAYPYVCYDHLNAFTCGCPESDPNCDALNWRIKVVIGVLCTLIGLFIIAAIVFYLYKKNLTKTWDINADDDDDQLRPISITFLEPGSSDQDVNNPAFVDGKGEKTDGDENQASTSDEGCSSTQLPKIVVSLQSDGSEKTSRSSSRSSISGSSSSDSGSSQSETSSKKKSPRPSSGLRKSNAVGDSSSLNAKASPGDEEISKPSCDDPSPSGRSHLGQSLKTDADASPIPAPRPSRLSGIQSAWTESNQSSGKLQKDDEDEDDLQHEAPGAIGLVPMGPSKSPIQDTKEDSMGEGLFEMKTPPSPENIASQEMQLPGSFKDFSETDVLHDIEDVDESKV